MPLPGLQRADTKPGKFVELGGTTGMTTQTLVLSHRNIDLQQIFRDRYKNRKNRDNCEVKVNLNK